MDALQQLYDITSDSFLQIDEHMIMAVEDDLQQQINQLRSCSRSPEEITMLKQCLKSKAMLEQLKKDYQKWNKVAFH